MNITDFVPIIVFASLSGFLLTLVLTVVVRAVARRIGMVDRPDGHRKLHKRATPQGGGIAVFLATSSVLAILVIVPNPWRVQLNDSLWPLVGLFLAGLVIVAAGMVDDIWGLRGRQKLFIQCVAAVLLMGYGLRIGTEISVFGNHIHLGLLALPLTLFWLLGAVNSVNLLDGIDGLATTVGVILAATLGAMAVVSMSVDTSDAARNGTTVVIASAAGTSDTVSDGTTVADASKDSAKKDKSAQTTTMIVAIVFTCSLLGFLRFNFPPASIFLGDSGSMLIGLVVGAIAILGSFKTSGTVLLAAPLAVWTIPILDSAAAVLRRRLAGRSIYVTDRAHLHHRLLNLLGSNRRVLGVIAICCAFTSAAALVSVYYQMDVIAMVAAISVVVVFVVTGIFGRVELLLLASRLRHVGRSLITSNGPGESSISQTSVRLQGSRNWELLWETLTDAADPLSFTKIHLDLNIPSVQEGYTATWNRSGTVDARLSWQINLPLIVAGRPAGRLQIVCACNGISICQQMEQLAILLEPFEKDLRSLAEEEGAARESAATPHLKRHALHS